MEVGRGNAESGKEGFRCHVSGVSSKRTEDRRQGIRLRMSLMHMPDVAGAQTVI